MALAKIKIPKRKTHAPGKEVTAARQTTKQPAFLLSRHEIVALTGFTYPWLWQMMRAGKFPRSRIVGGKSMWLSSEIEEWLGGLPIRPLKGDPTVEENAGAQAGDAA